MEKVEFTKAVLVNVHQFEGRNCMIINPSRMTLTVEGIEFANYSGVYKVPFYGENAQEKAWETFRRIFGGYKDGYRVFNIMSPKGHWISVSDDSDEWDGDDTFHFKFTLNGKKYDAPGAVQVYVDEVKGKIKWGLNVVIGGYHDIHWMDSKQAALSAYSMILKAITEGGDCTI